MAQDKEQLARLAVEMALSQLRQAEESASRVLPARLVVRASTSACPAPKNT
jgi:DNA-binding LacI/PurR family transcriptional regulator